LVKLFKRFSIFNRIWRIFNYTLLSIFGISLVDSYEIEFISKFFHGIFDIFSNFYDSIFGLLSKKVDIPVKETPSSMTRLNTSQSNATGVTENNRIIERFTKIIHKDNEIIPEDNESYYKNKYVLLLGLLLLSGLTWYFWDDIRPAGTSILAWLNALRSRPSSEPDGPKGSLPGTPKATSVSEVIDPVDLIPDNKSSLQIFKDKLFNRFYRNDKPLSDNPSPDIKLGTGSPSLKDLQNMKLDMHPTGEFINKSTENINSITKFIDDFKSKSLEGTPDANLLLYNYLRGELFFLYTTYTAYYNDWKKKMILLMTQLINL
jgi:hypothetical protein